MSLSEVKLDALHTLYKLGDTPIPENIKDTYLPFFHKKEDTAVATHRKRQCFYLTEEKTYIKRFSYRNSDYIKDKFRGWFFLETPALRQLKVATQARGLGFELVKPLFVITKKTSIFKQESLLVTQEQSGEIMNEFVYNTEDLKIIKSLFDRILLNLKEMHNKGFTYGATPLRNIIYHNNDFYWCDFDGLEFKANLSRQLRDIRRLTVSLLKNTKKIDKKTLLTELKKSVRKQLEWPEIINKFFWWKIKSYQKQARIID